MAEWFSIEVFDARFSARSWAESYGDSLLYAAQLEGATDWNWHYHGWGAVLEIELPDEFTWERLCEAPMVRAAPIERSAVGECPPDSFIRLDSGRRAEMYRSVLTKNVNPCDTFSSPA